MKLEEIAKFHRAMARSVPDATTRSWHRQAAELLADLAERRASHAKHVREGLAEAARQGKKLGRSRIPAEKEERIRAMLSHGTGTAAIMSEVGCGAAAVVRLKREMGLELGKPGRPAGE